MGYYTRYDIRIYDCQNEENELKVLREIVSRIEGKDPDTIDNDEIKWYFEDQLKWYDHENDMLEVSKMFPDLTFVLEGEGEENGDLWVKYFSNGETEACYAEIIYPQPENPKFQYLM